SRIQVEQTDELADRINGQLEPTTSTTFDLVPILSERFRHNPEEYEQVSYSERIQVEQTDEKHNMHPEIQQQVDNMLDPNRIFTTQHYGQLHSQQQRPHYNHLTTTSSSTYRTTGPYSDRDQITKRRYEH
ncbi:unnamed protein product, partial [Didymodactylos carnosus]